MKYHLIATTLACIGFTSSATSAVGHHRHNLNQPTPPESILEHSLGNSQFSLRDTAPICNVQSFITSNSDELIKEIKQQDYECIRPLYEGDRTLDLKIFTNPHLTAVAKYLQEHAKSYDGKGDLGQTNLYAFLRAAYFAEFYNPQLTLSPEIQKETKQALDAFVSNEHFYANSLMHGLLLEEVITTMDSARLQHVYVNTAVEWFKRWDSQYASHETMRNAINRYFTLLSRGLSNDNPEYVKQIINNTELVTALGDLALRKQSVGTEEELLASNAARELSRFISLFEPGEPTQPIEPIVVSKLKDIFETYESYGPGDSIWLAAAQGVMNPDEDDDEEEGEGEGEGESEGPEICEKFNICGFENTLKQKVFKHTYTCSNSVQILYNEMTAEQTSSACQALASEENYFHEQLETAQTPVKDDHNTQLNVNIFNSNGDYNKYAGFIFDIDTNNGGVYLEGEPSKVGNVANFVAFQLAPDESSHPTHRVWNLEHEFIHYLDGRYNLYGNVEAPTEPVVWWTEGIAEYISKKTENVQASQTAKDGSTYTLGAIFETNYDDADQDQVYHWSYLAVRFMFEKHKQDLNQMLNHTRSGNWSAYKTLTQNWSSTKQEEFKDWLCEKNTEGKATIHISNQPTSTNGNTISFTTNTCNDKPFVATEYLWSFGDGKTSTDASPSHQYTIDDKTKDNYQLYTVTLQAKDDKGNYSTSTSVVRVNKKGVTTPPTPTPGATPSTSNSAPSKSNGAGGGLFMFLIVALGRAVSARKKRIK